MADAVRIQKALADAGVASRRAADALVADGRVTVNGRPAIQGQRVDPDRDRILVDGRPVAAPERRIYLALAKPAGVTSTVSDRHARRTVLDLVPAELRGTARLYPVGRLDRESEGLMLLTNDGAWAHRVLHPSHEIEREYAVALAEPLDEERIRRLTAGIPLAEGTARLVAIRAASRAEAARLSAPATGLASGRWSRPSLTWYHVILRQGWKRQLRRMFAAVDAPVARLVRVRVGGLRLGTMRPGEVRLLSAAERDRVTGPTRPRPRAPACQVSGPPGIGGPGPSGLIVSLDGPGSSGKSSVGAEAAIRLGYRFLDTGVLYRALAWLCAERGTDPDEGSLPRLVEELQLAPDEEGRLRRIRVKGRDVTHELHAPRVDRLVSRVAARPDVREAFLPLQRSIARPGRIIVAGRDIGSVVLPDADLKLYLEVSLEERARRRAADRGVAADPDEVRAILADLRRRDHLDSTRRTAPLRVPRDAVVVRSDDATFEETVERVVAIIRARAASGPGVRG
jgi:cytidylate kinase